MNMEELEIGNSYACRFRATAVLNAQGEPVSPLEMLEGTAEPQTYEGLGVIKIRDTEQRLVELEDVDSGRMFVVSWDDCWDIDTVTWRDPLDPA